MLEQPTCNKYKHKARVSESTPIFGRSLQIPVALRVCIALAVGLLVQPVEAQDFQFKYRPSPIDNPVRGLVPYVSAMPWFDTNSSEEEADAYRKKFQEEIFPHSIEFSYFSMRELMPQKGKVDFSPIEKWLEQANRRGCQLTFRVYLEYPNQDVAVPQFLIDDGLKITKWKNDNKETLHAPDYNNENLRTAIDFLIAELGKKYDQDPRVACLTMGVLGHWGEWHSYPREKLFPDKKYQIHIMDQFENAFSRKPVLMRYPAGKDDWSYAPNADRNFGFHDDSFAWSTLDSGKEEDDWFFMSKINAAKLGDGWKTRMIGGEIRPEVWGIVFDDNAAESEAQDFDQCVRATHVTWLMDSGLFDPENKPSAMRISNATRSVGKMGYEFFIPKVSLSSEGGSTTVNVSIENRGVAPFYFDWPVEIAILNASGNIRESVKQQWDLPSILPDGTATRTVKFGSKLQINEKIGIRIANPMTNGNPIRFANENQQLVGQAWLLIE